MSNPVYQPRYQSYLDAGGEHNEKSHHLFMEFILIMISLYRECAEIRKDYPVTNHDEFTSFIQQFVEIGT